VEYTTPSRQIRGILCVLEHSVKYGSTADCVASKRGRACRGLSSQSAIKIPAA
ncbi:unnamed protein product, partial [Hymenolepis diminuta]